MDSLLHELFSELKPLIKVDPALERATEELLVLVLEQFHDEIIVIHL